MLLLLFNGDPGAEPPVIPPAVAVPAGHGTLADAEAEWRKVEAADEQPAKVRRKVKREAARATYFTDPLPDVAQVYVARLQAEKASAEFAEMRALLDLQTQTSTVRADIARAAVVMARKKQAQAAQQLEEFDVMYIASILANA